MSQDADYVATLEVRLRAAEDVCLMFGWAPAREETPRDKAATALWQHWALLVGEKYLRPKNHPHLNDEAVARMAAARDAIVAETLRRIDGSPPPQRCYVHTFVTIDNCGCSPDPSLLLNDGPEGEG